MGGKSIAIALNIHIHRHVLQFLWMRFGADLFIFSSMFKCTAIIRFSIFSLFVFYEKQKINLVFSLFLSLAWNFKIAPCWVINLFVGHCQPDQARAMLHMLIGSGVKTSSFRRKHNLTSDSSKPIFCGSFPTLLLSCSHFCDGQKSKFRPHSRD